MSLQNLYDLEAAAKNGWILSTKQVAELLGVTVKVVSREESLDRHGFNFTREGTVGAEIGWRVSKKKSTRKTTR